MDALWSSNNATGGPGLPSALVFQNHHYCPPPAPLPARILSSFISFAPLPQDKKWKRLDSDHEVDSAVTHIELRDSGLEVALEL